MLFLKSIHKLPDRVRTQPKCPRQCPSLNRFITWHLMKSQCPSHSRYEGCCLSQKLLEIITSFPSLLRPKSPGARVSWRGRTISWEPKPARHKVIERDVLIGIYLYVQWKGETSFWPGENNAKQNTKLRASEEFSLEPEPGHVDPTEWQDRPRRVFVSHPAVLLSWYVIKSTVCNRWIHYYQDTWSNVSDREWLPYC